MISLPGTTKQWQQANNSDLFGNIHVTKNINFDSAGYLRLSYSPRSVINETIDANFDDPATITYSEDFGYFVQTRDKPYQVDTSILAVLPTEITGGTLPVGTEKADSLYFGAFMAVTDTTGLLYYDPSTNSWTDTNVVLTNTSGSQHPLTVALNRTALAVGNVNTVLLYATPLTATPTLLDTLTIMSTFYITDICYFNQNIYIATTNVYGGNAFLYVWNAQGTAAQSAFEVDSNIIYSVCVYQDSVVLVTGSGALLRFNGSGFTILDAFPIFYTERALSDVNSLRMYHNVLKPNTRVLEFILADNENTIKTLNQPDGLWCYDPDVGLYNKSSNSISTVVIDSSVTTGDVNTTTNQITTPAAPVTGTEAIYRNGGGSSISPLESESKYFVIKIDATHIQLAETIADAIAGTAIDLTTTGNNAQDIIFFPNVDFGQYFITKGTALQVIDRPVAYPQYGIDFIWGSELATRNNSTLNGYLGTVSPTVESRGYFITPKIYSKDVTDVFNHVDLKFSPFTSGLDKIIIKYRTQDDKRDTISFEDGSWSATWTSSTTFTSTETELADTIVGDEIEILRGAAAGLLAHIDAISENAGTYTITIDETYDNYAAGDASYFVARNWIKWETIEYGDSNAEQCFIFDQIGKSGKFIQLKVELRGVNVRIEELLVDNIYRIPFKGK